MALTKLVDGVRMPITAAEAGQETKAQLAARKAASAQARADKESLKQAAIGKLIALGLTLEEVKVLIG